MNNINDFLNAMVMYEANVELEISAKFEEKHNRQFHHPLLLVYQIHIRADIFTLQYYTATETFAALARNVIKATELCENLLHEDF